MENFDKKHKDFAFHASRFTFHVSRFTFHVLLLLLPMLMVHIPFAAAQQRNAAQIITEALRHQNLGLAYLEESQPSKAVEEFQALVNLVPDEPIGYGNLAVAYLRLKRGEEAEQWVKRGIEVNPMNSKLHLILSEVYQWGGKAEEGVAQIQEAVKLAPEDMEPRYLLVRYYLGQRNNPEATGQAITHLRTLRQQSPTNVVVRLKLAQALLERDQIEEAKQICMELSALLWDADADALKFLKDGQRLMNQGDAKGAARQIRIFENVQRITPRYQQGIGELVTDILGHPIEKFSPGFRARMIAKQSPPIGLRFVDVTQEVGLGNLEEKRVKVILTDYDNDGALDVYALPSRRTENPVDELFRNEGGKFVPVAKIARSGLAAAFADFDKDGDQDVYVSESERDQFFRNDGESKFTDITEATGIHNNGTTPAILFVDYDHDGDLDLFLANREHIEMYRNNGDGTFSDVTQQTFLPSTVPPSPPRPEGTRLREGQGVRGASDAVFGDFDDDGDIDLFVINSKNGCTLYTNLRQGKMQAITDKTGIPQDRHFIAVAAGDYDN
ncbi:VCBS repeat-containing protein, partial [Candidatus Poribacteria bacterium]|nr:VCBS repeat-containing protein [Candidatus Poribacteria bacterium]